MEIKFIKKEEIAKDTTSFFFEKPVGFSFLAGQFGKFTLDYLGEGLSHYFSFSSAPYEEFLTFTTRIRAQSLFKKQLFLLEKKNTLLLTGPMGGLVLPHKTDQELVFLAGGIGITPFYSMFKQVFHSGEHFKIRLFYSNKDLQSSAFLEELFNWEKTVEQFYFFPTMTDLEEGSDWPGLKKRIDAGLLVENLGSFQDKHFFIAGPPAFTDAMEKMLLENQVMSKNISVESFTGY